MKQKHVGSLLIIILSSVLGYQLIDLVNYLYAPKAISFDTKIEKPQPLDLNLVENSRSEKKLSRNKVKNALPQFNNSSSSLKNLKGSNKATNKTKPLEKNKFLNVIRVAEEEYRYSKEDYEGLLKKNQASGLIAVESNWEKKILESETVIEKSLSQAAKNLKNTHTIANPSPSFKNDMERYALKIELPEADDGTKFKLQYREPPDFGKKTQLPEMNLPKPATKTATFSIERTKATESPWDNFSDSKNFVK